MSAPEACSMYEQSPIAIAAAAVEAAEATASAARERSLHVMNHHHPRLLSLPDELLSRIFVELACLPSPLPHWKRPSASLRGRALYDHCRHAFALACTCRRLLRVFADVCLPSFAPRLVPSASISGRSPFRPMLQSSSHFVSSSSSSPSPSPSPSLSSSTSSLSNRIQWRGNAATYDSHACAIIRIAGACLTKLVLRAYPPDVNHARQSMFPMSLLLTRRRVAEPYDVSRMMHAIAQHITSLRELCIDLPRLRTPGIFADNLKIVLTSCQHSLRTLYITQVDFACANTLISASPILCALRELRMPGYKGGYRNLRTILETFGTNLTLLELSVCDAASIESEPLQQDMASLTDGHFMAMASSCYRLENLKLGPLRSRLAPLGPAFMKSCVNLRVLTLHSLSGDLNSDNCYAMDLVRLACMSCPRLDDVHMIDCDVIGESAELFQVVGYRLRSFTGAFYWETSDELMVFAQNCPRVQSLTLRCGQEGQNDVCCDEGAVHACTSFGPNLRYLLIANTNMEQSAFINAVCAAKNVEDLELVSIPKVQASVVNDILAAIGRGIRSLTITWAPILDPQDAEFEEDLCILHVVSAHCPLLEELHVPDIFHNCSLNPVRVVRIKDAFARLERNCRFLDIDASMLSMQLND